MLRAAAFFLALAAVAAAAPGPGFASLDPVWTNAPVRGADAPVLGNGTLFGSVWLGPAGGFNWELHRRGVPLQELGNCHLQTNDGFDTGTAALDLWNGELRGSLSSEHGEVRYLSFVVRDPSVLVIQLTHRNQGGTLLAWLPAFHAPVPHVIVTPGEVSSVQMLSTGQAIAVVQRRIESRPERKTYVVAMEPGTDAAAALAAATAVVERASQEGWAGLMVAHRTQWHRAYRDARPVAAADRAFWLQRYQSLSLGLNP